MKKIYSLYVFAAFILFLCNALPVAAQEVIELNQPNANKVVIKLMFRNGSVCDPAGKEGLTEFTTTMITQGGNSTMTKSMIDETIYPWSASISSSVDKEVSIFTFECPNQYLNSFYPIIISMMTTPSFGKDDFLRIQSNQQNYVDEVIRSSSDEEYSKKALEDLLFRGTSYQHMVEGTSKGVRSFGPDDVRVHYQRYYTANRLLIGVAGNYPSDLVSKLKNDLKMGPGPVLDVLPVQRPKMPNGLQIEIVQKDNALGSAICMGFPIELTRRNDEFAALMVANSWLGEHRKSYSHLYKKIREERSMNYGDYSYIEWYDNGGSNMLPPPGVPRNSNYFSLWIRPVQTADGLKKQYPELSDIKIGHAHFAIRMALNEMQQLIDKGMSQEDFEATRTFLRSYMKLYIQSTETQLGYLMDSRFYGRKDYISEMNRLLESLTLDQVNGAMKKYWQTQNMYVTIVTDKSEAVPLMKSLESNAASPMSYSKVLKSSLNADILKEDKQVEGYPLNVKSVKIVNSADTFQDQPDQKAVTPERVVPELKQVK
ncbi:MAG: pitrilysin family protein [Bacteroidota bacterium]